jgi:hypothetical protein
MRGKAGKVLTESTPYHPLDYISPWKRADTLRELDNMLTRNRLIAELMTPVRQEQQFKRSPGISTKAQSLDLLRESKYSRMMSSGRTWPRRNLSASRIGTLKARSLEAAWRQTDGLKEPGSPIFAKKNPPSRPIAVSWVGTR